MQEITINELLRGSEYTVALAGNIVVQGNTFRDIDYWVDKEFNEYIEQSNHTELEKAILSCNYDIIYRSEDLPQLELSKYNLNKFFQGQEYIAEKIQNTKDKLEVTYTDSTLAEYILDCGVVLDDTTKQGILESYKEGGLSNCFYYVSNL